MKIKAWRWGMALGSGLVLLAGCESDPTSVPALEVEWVEIDPAETQLAVGDTVRLVAHPRTSDGQILGSYPVAWSTPTPALVTVTPQGFYARITGTGAGTAVVRATSGGKTGQVEIVLNHAEPVPGPVATVELDADSVVLEEGETHVFTATALDAHGVLVPGRWAQWSSSDPEVLQISPLGEVTAVRPGTAVVTARIDGRDGTATARVSADYPWELVFSGWSGVPGEHPGLYGIDLADPAGTPVPVGPAGGAGDPNPSPDGSRIAWIGLTGSYLRGIYVSDLDGGEVRELLVTHDATCGQLAWSPDGSRIAFACRMDDDDQDIWIMDASDGGNLTNLTDDHPHNQEWPAWSPALPDGSYRIAYMQYVDGEPRIWTMKEDGSDPKEITSGMDAQPAWSPDGTTIAFVRTGVATFGDIWLVDAEGGNERSFVGIHLAGPQLSPTWSPDGRLLAFASTHATYGAPQAISQIYTVWADGSKLARRTGGDLDKHNPAWRVK